MSINKIEAFEGDNTGGLNSIQIIPFEDIADMPLAINGILPDNIVLAEGKEWVAIKFTLDTSGFDEKPGLDKRGPFFEQSIFGFVPKDDADQNVNISKMFRYRKFIIKALDNNGNTKVMGTPEAPAKFSYTRSTSDKFPGLNGFKLNFACLSIDACPTLAAEGDFNNDFNNDFL